MQDLRRMRPLIRRPERETTIKMIPVRRTEAPGKRPGEKQKKQAG